MKTILPPLALLFAVAAALALMRPAFEAAPYLVAGKEVISIPAAEDLRPRRPIEGEAAGALASLASGPGAHTQYTVVFERPTQDDVRFGAMIVGTGGSIRTYVNGVELNAEGPEHAGAVAAEIARAYLHTQENRLDAVARTAPRGVFLGPYEELKRAAQRHAAIERLGAIVIALAGGAAALIGFFAAFASRQRAFLFLPSVIALLIAGAAALDWLNPGAEGALIEAARRVLLAGAAVLLLMIVAGENETWPRAVRMMFRAAIAGLIVLAGAAAAALWSPDAAFGAASVVADWAGALTVLICGGAALVLALGGKAMRAAWTPGQRAVAASLALSLVAGAVAETSLVGAPGYLFGRALSTVAASSALVLWVALVAARVFLDLESDLRKFLGLERIVREQEARLAEQQLALEKEIGRRAVLEERERFSKDIHDGLGGSLVGLLMRSRTGELESAELEDGLTGALQDLRLMVDALDHAEDLAPAAFATFQTRIAPIFAAAGIALDWRQDDLGAFSLKNRSDMLHVLRILQEACTNVVRHSGATAATVRIGVRPDAGGLEVEVTDNGAAKAPGGSAGKGLKNMAGRALSIGGALTAGACDEGGWRVRLDLPGA